MMILLPRDGLRTRRTPAFSPFLQNERGVDVYVLVLLEEAPQVALDGDLVPLLQPLPLLLPQRAADRQAALARQPRLVEPVLRPVQLSNRPFDDDLLGVGSV